MGYTKEVVKGISWVGAFRGASRGIAFVRTIILARLLVPSQFGLVGIATIVLGFVEMVTETGINIFLVQEKKIDKYIDTAWIVSIMRGFIIAILIAAASPFVSQFFSSPDSHQLLLLISIVPIIRGFINPAIVNFQKELAFDREFWFRLLIFSVDSITAIIFAIITRSASSLIFGFIVGAVIEVILSFLVIRSKPTFHFDIFYMREIFHKGKWVTVFSAVNYAFQNGDSAIVGKVLGSFSLGLYQIGYKFASIPSEVVDSISRVTFPVYAKIAEDKTRLRWAFLRTTGVTALFAILFGVTLFLFTQQLVLLLLGEKWLEVVPALKVLAIFGVVRAISASAFPLFLSVKKQNYVTFITLVSFTGLMISIIPLVSYFGIVGAALGAFVGTMMALPFTVYYCWRIIR